MCELNDIVVFGRHGVYKISDIVKKKSNDEIEEFYVLKSLNKNNSLTIYIPVNNKSSIGKMRRVITKDEIFELIHIMQNEQTVWIEDNNERARKYRSIISSGNHKDIIKLIKTLYLRKQELKALKKRLYLADENCLRDAEKILHNEFSAVLEIKPDQVMPFIIRQICLSHEL